ncbi:hypothetical protein J31TS4_11020 [Paenibacillus sp. J31TS4]|uniref:AroM family protein n=1 Tax=Paenibacillus sp. J31TS4 TaxID=2807195 RepID=UPI001B25B902|nr:AroM family protein [Paenibacillus sp. J31TS4]GIP37822.1 hypothetical protein J31TS4_11020 [Paenibacillus sp. J31TS4]
MQKIGMLTIGQAPRPDAAPILERQLAGRAQLIQAGALDGMNRRQVEDELAPREGEYTLTSRLSTGEPVVMGREKLQPLLQEKIDLLERAGIRTILLLCTGVFPGLQSASALLLEPDRILPPVVRAMVGERRLGVLVPLEEQKESLRHKYEAVGLKPVFAAASPYVQDPEPFRLAAEELRGNADVLLLDCMGYTEEARTLVSRASDLPVVLSSALMAKLLSELI